MRRGNNLTQSLDAVTIKIVRRGTQFFDTAKPIADAFPMQHFTEESDAAPAGIEYSSNEQRRKTYFFTRQNPRIPESI